MCSDCVLLDWQVGDVVLVKYSSWPWWPAVVSDVPSGKQRSVCVQFVDKSPSYAFIKME